MFNIRNPVRIDQEQSAKSFPGVSGTGAAAGRIRILKHLQSALEKHGNHDNNTAMTLNRKSAFDKAAAAWDEKPRRVRLAGDVANAVKSRIPLGPEMDALDFGCGTGLLTLALQPFVRSITGVDSSAGMLSMLAEKTQQQGVSNVDTRLLDIEQDEVLTGSYHLVVSSMTLHHIPQVEQLFDQFKNILIPGGYLGVADLDAEGGKFHEDNTGVFHFGFDRAELARELTAAGFRDVADVTASEITKQPAENHTESFTVFLLTARA
ncbi:MAG: class I SAM-dependent methyltransferase [Desulfobacterales bacterium]|nr:class I SAM-dependent methyltransferase [Desulfobacterales bacterium]MBS3754999.1 class I SAM-dependent methyltransferase [Desulfobacterales bacterium]